ncbi:HAD domain-containing protein [Lentzea sp. NPDC058450]|uniref:HAD domain-containing protein n=1 Tax=Lentzea sp. NPDC058450 TaxID=3346505 RepID=UPI00364A9CB4
MADRPLVFLDVDGTLLPYAEVELPTTVEGWVAWQLPSNPHLTKIDRGHGPRLRALPCDLVWATGWMHDANAVIAPLLDLPQLPVAELPEAPYEDDMTVVHWKTRALIDIAAGRPFAWVDDEIGELDREWVAANHNGQALLLRVDARTGLTSGDLATVEDWLRQAAGCP